MLLLIAASTATATVSTCVLPTIPDELQLRRDWINIWRKNVRVITARHTDMEAIILKDCFHTNVFGTPLS